MKLSQLNALNYDFTAKRDMTGRYLIAQDLSNLDLSNAILDEAEFDCAVLSNADLSDTSLKQTSFFSADLEGANLSGAKVNNCNFRHANLEGANVTGVDFSNSNVKGAIFTDAIGLSFQQKQWLKENGALNISFDRQELQEMNLDGGDHGFFSSIKNLFSFSH